MVKISKFGEDFLFLALRIDKHIKGYIDFYFGPEKIKKTVENESISSLNKLLSDNNALLNELGAQGYNKERERYLEKLLIAMKTSIEILNSTEIPIEDQFLQIYDVPLKPVNESEIKSLKDEFDKAYPGPGSLEERMNKYGIRRKVPEKKVFELFKKALDLVRNRTKELFLDILPKEEKIFIKLVNDKESRQKIKWTCYNWYLGNFASRIEVNPSYHMYWTAFLIFTAHEGYPGHHTEFVLKEQKLYQEQNQFEHSLLILHSPKLIITEGIGSTAINVIYSNQELAEIGLTNFCPDPSKDDPLEVLIAQNNLRGKNSLFLYDLAYRTLIDKYSNDELLEYGKSLELFSEEEIRNHLKRFSSPVYSKVAFMYELGSYLIRNKYGAVPSIKNFQNLLVNPVLPSDLIE
ncbi:MAG: hypothetical protein KGD70_04430 [Candidatus Lokiarchaeota archaeon]|nr:hypothetical protein [Candidatus Lokiarchaeota archaeon]